jgi:hypothetical protein
VFGLLHLFEASYINGAGAFARSPALSEGIISMKYAATPEIFPALVRADTTAAGIKLEPLHAQNVPQQWIVAVRLALVAFMTTSWFLSRSYTTTMYLILGLATATIALQRGDTKPADRGHWIFSSIAVEVILIVVIYGLVRLRH